MIFIESVMDNIRQNFNEIFSAEQKVADFILKNPETAVAMNVSELAEASGVSDATTIRMCKHLGYKGFYQMKLKLAHDIGRDQIISGSLKPKDPHNIDDVFTEVASNLMKVRNNAKNINIMKCVKSILECNTVHVVAAGNSIPSSIDFAYRLGRVGIRNSSSFMTEQHFNNIHLGTKKDVVFGISHSGSSKHVLQAFDVAKKKKMCTISVVDLPRSPLANQSDLSICSGVEYSSVNIYGTASHLYITAILDIIIYFVDDIKQKEKDKGEEINFELVLSEGKV